MPIQAPRIATLAECGGNVALWAEKITGALQSFMAQLEREAQREGRGTLDRFNVRNHTPNRTLDESTATAAQVAQVVGTLLLELNGKRVVRAGEPP